MFRSVLIANRGEIAVRVIRTLRALGVRSVVVYTDSDAGARHVAEADDAVRVDSYLSIDAVLDAARRAGAQAVHPGYGFLAENAAFARACEDSGVVFVGPPPAAIDAMGDKIRAKALAAEIGVPVVPGVSGDALGTADDAVLAAAAREIGFPILVKPSAGGGGKGMHAVHDPAELAEAIAGARREARSSFGDDTLLLERLIARPRHIEVQVLADAHGTVLHLGERECSLQRRHQKIVEEAPSALGTDTHRAGMTAAAIEVARAVGYTGAGTVEFLVDADRPDEFFFLEMNTRLQVEHPVTELTTGLDLVELQLRVAAGERLPLTQDDVRLAGHAVEARVYAEDPAAGFLPTGGRVLALREPAGPGVRVDFGVRAGELVGSSYDPMLGKVIAYGATREEALRRLDAALADTVLLGVGTNLAFLRALLADPDVRAGRLDTGLVERRSDDWARPELPREVPTAAALHALLALEPSGQIVDPFELPGGWRIGEPAWTRWRVLADGHDPVPVRTRGRATRAQVAVGDAAPVDASAATDGDDLVVSLDGSVLRFALARDGERVWLGRRGQAWALREQPPLEAAGGAGGAGGWSGPRPDARDGHGRGGDRGAAGQRRGPAAGGRGDEDGARAHRAGGRNRSRAPRPPGRDRRAGRRARRDRGGLRSVRRAQ